MKDLGYYNGEVGPLSEMKVAMLDRACVFGDGVYDATRARGGNIFALDEHIERIFNNAMLIDIKPPCTKDEMAMLLNELVAQVDADNVFVYWQITRGTAPRTQDYDPSIKANLWVMLFEKKLDLSDTEWRCITHEDTRFMHCNIKTLNLLPAVMYAQAAKKKACDEAILVRDGYVTECAHSNVHILKDAILYTHPADHLILPGIMRAHLIKQAKRIGLAVDEVAFTPERLMEADEVFISGSGSLIKRVVEIDGARVGGGNLQTANTLINAIHQEFLDATA